MLDAYATLADNGVIDKDSALSILREMMKECDSDDETTIALLTHFAENGDGVVSPTDIDLERSERDIVYYSYGSRQYIVGDCDAVDALEDRMLDDYLEEHVLPGLNCSACHFDRAAWKRDAASAGYESTIGCIEYSEVGGYIVMRM